MPITAKKTCFVIAPIGAKDSDVRKRSDKVLKHIFKKALAKKYKVIRGDEIDQPGIITSQVLRAIQDSHLVLADLTGHNPNVLYELAIRHAIEKPIIHVIDQKISKITFDIAGFRTIEFDLTDPDSIENAVEQLKNHAEEAEKGNWGETPVKLANIMQKSKEDTPMMLLLKEAVAGIAELRTSRSPHFSQGTAVTLSTLGVTPNALAVYAERASGGTIFEAPFVPGGTSETPAAKDERRISDPSSARNTEVLTKAIRRIKEAKKSIGT
jgi:hypothetical protein